MKIAQPKKPLARTKKIVVKEVSGEVLIYDLESDKVHCLNETAALVWKYSDGKNDPATIARLLERDLKSPVTENVVWYALSQFEKDGLLEGQMTPPALLSGMSRRDVIRALGVAAVVAVPVVTSIVAPTPAQAATCLPSGQSCTSSSQCCSGLCSGVTCA